MLILPAKAHLLAGLPIFHASLSTLVVASIPLGAPSKMRRALLSKRRFVRLATVRVLALLTSKSTASPATVVSPTVIVALPPTTLVIVATTPLTTFTKPSLTWLSSAAPILLTAILIVPAPLVTPALVGVSFRLRAILTGTAHGVVGGGRPIPLPGFGTQSGFLEHLPIVAVHLLLQVLLVLVAVQVLFLTVFVETRGRSRIVLWLTTPLYARAL